MMFLAQSGTFLQRLEQSCTGQTSLGRNKLRYSRVCQINCFLIFQSTAQKTIRFCSQISELSSFFWFDNCKLPKFPFEIYKGIHSKIQRKNRHFSFLHFCQILFQSNDSSVHRSICLIETVLLIPILSYPWHSMSNTKCH